MKKRVKKKRGVSYVFRLWILLVISFLAFLTVVLTFPKTHPALVQKVKPTANASDDLTLEEYKKIDSSLAALVQQKNPRAALAQLQSLMNIDPKVLRSCHGLVHDIGHAAYKKYGDFTEALSYQDDLCGSGYLHGVIEQDFASSKDFFNAMQTVCAGYSRLPGKCYHGIGHGFMYYTGNNIPLSLYYCSTYASPQAKIYCSEGVFMENFNSEANFHPTKYLRPTDPFYPCHEQSEFYKDSCYFYAPDYYLTLHKKEYTGALKWCDTAETNFIHKCIIGVGSRMMKQNIGSPEYVESLCMKASSPDKVASCIDGMVSYYLVQTLSLTQGKNLCSTLRQENQSTCYQSVANRSGMFFD